MKDFTPIQSFTSDGVYSAGKSPLTQYSISCDGFYGGAQVEFGYLGITGFVRWNIVPVFTDNAQHIADTMMDVELAWRVTGATNSTKVTVALHELFDHSLYCYDGVELHIKSLN